MAVAPGIGVGIKVAIALGSAAAAAAVAVVVTREAQAPHEPSAAARPAEVSSQLAVVPERDTTAVTAPAAIPDPAAPAAMPDPAAPRFDVVRVAPDGAGLVAGRADPGAHVTLRAGDLALAEVEAGPGGDFVATFRAAPGDTPQILTLDAGGADAPVGSEESVVLLPPAVIAAVPGQAGPSAGVPEAPGAEAEAQAEEAAAEAPPGAEPFVAATAILRPDAEAAEVRPADEALGVRSGRLSLSTIDYGETGLVTLAGYAPAGARIRVYVDGAAMQEATAGEDGRWQASLDALKEGSYTLRVDALGTDGRVASRVETPFRRETPDAGAMPGSITVQPGNNLWTIARMRYGAGMHYTTIFTANADVIENPDMIFPGQIFTLPQIEAEAATAGEGAPRPRP